MIAGSMDGCEWVESQTRSHIQTTHNLTDHLSLPLSTILSWGRSRHWTWAAASEELIPTTYWHKICNLSIDQADQLVELLRKRLSKHLCVGYIRLQHHFGRFTGGCKRNFSAAAPNFSVYLWICSSNLKKRPISLHLSQSASG